MPVDLTQLVHDVGRQLAAAEPERKVELVVAEGLTVKADPVLTRIAFENLLGNAWKFTRGKSAARVEVFTSDTGSGPAVCVRDDGAGFDMAFASKLFVPFQRLHTVDEFAGTGVGLATVQRIVQRHGGHIWAEGAVGAGATFSLTLPAAGAEDGT